jgi:anti-sigma regulatory factor (Ser/Thr protein kinase)
VDRILPIVYDLEEAIGILHGAAVPSLPPGPGPKSSAAKSEPYALPSGPAALSAIVGRLGLSIKNELSELKRLNAAIAQFLDTHRVPYRAAYAVNLAIDELVTNVLRYAYVDFDVHVIEIELAVESDQVILRIVDDGRPFDPRRGPMLDQHAEDRETGGLGLLLVLDMVDVLEYRREEEKNCVEVRIRMIAENGAVDSATAVAPETAVEER